MRNLVAGMILLSLGTLLLLDNLGIADFGDMVEIFWPLLLVALGAGILLRRSGGSERPAGAAAGEAFPPPPRAGSAPQPGESTGDLIHQSVVFGDIFFAGTSQNFKGGSLSTTFGDSRADLSRVRIAEGEHELRVHGIVGNTIITLPPGGAVSVRASSVLGEMSILGQQRGGFTSSLQTGTPSFSSSSNRLTLIISRVFGNITVE